MSGPRGFSVVHTIVICIETLSMVQQDLPCYVTKCRKHHSVGTIEWKVTDRSERASYALGTKVQNLIDGTKN